MSILLIKSEIENSSNAIAKQISAVNIEVSLSYLNSSAGSAPPNPLF